MAFPSDRPVVVVPPEHSPTYAVAGDVSVRLKRDRTISPTLLKHYQECPLRVRLQYIERIEPLRRYEHNLSQGLIAHDLLAMVARRMKRGMALPDRVELQMLVAKRVPAREFPSSAAHGAAIEQVVQWVQAGIRYLQRDDEGEIVLVERPQQRPFRADDVLRFTFRPDLVQWTADAEGPFLEILDYKTGKQRPEEIVPVVARFVINAFLEREGHRGWDVPARFTWVWLDHGESRSVELDAAACTDPWRMVSELTERLFAETEWSPRPSGLCTWCPFYRVACDGPDANQPKSPGLVFEEPGEYR